MPYKPKKPCAYHGCAELTHDRYCGFHAKMEMQKYNKYRRNPDTNKLYGRDWKKIRQIYLSRKPVCEICEKNKKIVPAVLVHHKVKLGDGGSHDYDNLMSLCSSCHERLHADSGDRF